METKLRNARMDVIQIGQIVRQLSIMPPSSLLTDEPTIGRIIHPSIEKTVKLRLHHQAPLSVALAFLWQANRHSDIRRFRDT